MLTKEKLKKAIDAVPVEFTVEDVIEGLIKIDKIEQGLKDVEDGNVYSIDEVRQKIDKWF